MMTGNAGTDGEDAAYIVVVRSWGNPRMPDRVVTVATEPEEIGTIQGKYDGLKQQIAILSGGPVFSQKSSFKV